LFKSRELFIMDKKRKFNGENQSFSEMMDWESYMNIFEERYKVYRK
jgi:hypothetical protein